MKWRVLKLDSSYRPIQVISWQDAMGMLFMGRAVMVEARSDVVVRSATEEFQVPAVIAIKRYVNKGRISLRVTRKNLFWRDKVEGCESPVWLATSDEQGNLMAYSPSKVIRGVLAVLLEKANELTPQQRSEFDFERYLSRCQLERYLSQSRGNGIKSVIAKLKGI